MVSVETTPSVHAEVVGDVHDVVPQLSTPVADIDDVKATKPKFSPVIVTMEPPDFARFTGGNALSLS